MVTDVVNQPAAPATCHGCSDEATLCEVNNMWTAQWLGWNSFVPLRIIIASDCVSVKKFYVELWYAPHGWAGSAELDVSIGHGTRDSAA
jgi:hypothetical protein